MVFNQCKLLLKVKGQCVCFFFWSISTYSDPLPSLHSRIPVERHNLYRGRQSLLFVWENDSNHRIYNTY